MLDFLQHRLGYDQFTVHGMRSTLRNWGGKRYSDNVMERVLAHVKGGVEGSYHTDAFFDERVGVMQAWSDYCFSDVPTGHRRHLAGCSSIERFRGALTPSGAGSDFLFGRFIHRSCDRSQVEPSARQCGQGLPRRCRRRSSRIYVVHFSSTVADGRCIHRARRGLYMGILRHKAAHHAHRSLLTSPSLVGWTRSAGRCTAAQRSRASWIPNRRSHMTKPTPKSSTSSASPSASLRSRKPFHIPPPLCIARSVVS